MREQIIMQKEEPAIKLDTIIDEEYDMPDYAIERMANFFLKRLRESPSEEILGI